MLMVHRAHSAAERLATTGIDVEVIDMRSLTPLDMETVAAPLAKTGRLLVVEEDNLTCGWGAEVLARVAESRFPPPSQAPDAPCRRPRHAPALRGGPRAGLRAGRRKNHRRHSRLTGITAADRLCRQLGIAEAASAAAAVSGMPDPISSSTSFSVVSVKWPRVLGPLGWLEEVCSEWL